MSRQRLGEFDIMRGLAIIIILFHHLSDYGLNYYDLHNFGINLNLSLLNVLNTYFGLGLFVYISGVLLQRNYHDLSGWRQVGTFIKKRFIRIFPLYYIALAIFIKLMAVSNTKLILMHVLGLQAILASYHYRPLLTLWYIGLVAVYYGFFILIKRAEGNKLRLFITLLIFPLLLLIWRGKEGMGDIRLFLYYPVFLSGLYGDKYLARIRNDYKKTAGLAIFFFLSVYSYVLYMYRSSLVVHSIGQLGAFLLISCIASCIMISFAWLVRLISSKGAGISKYFKILSYSSYCIYLFHRPVWWALLKMDYPADPMSRLFYLGLIGIPLIILISYTIQKAYDWAYRKAPWGWSTLQTQ